MIINLTLEQHRMLKEDYLVIDDEKFEFIKGSSSINDDGETRTIIFKRPRDGKFFEAILYWCRYGYEDYGYDPDYQNFNLYEVEPKEVTITKYVRVDKN